MSCRPHTSDLGSRTGHSIPSPSFRSFSLSTEPVALVSVCLCCEHSGPCSTLSQLPYSGRASFDGRLCPLLISIPLVEPLASVLTGLHGNFVNLLADHGGLGVPAPGLIARTHPFASEHERGADTDEQQILLHP